MLGFSPNAGFSQDAPINITENQSLSLEGVFELIKSQTDYRFVYRYDALKNAPHLTVEEGIVKTSELLKNGLRPIGYTFDFEENTIIVKKENKKSTNIIVQEKVDVFGVVRDSLGMPLAGVTVMVKNSKKAVSTNLEGEYKLSNVDVGSTVSFTHVGFVAKEIEIVSAGIAQNLVIVLKKDIGELEEIRHDDVV